MSSPNAYDVGSLPEPGPDAPGGGRRSRLVGSTGLRQEGAKGVAIAVVSTIVVFGAIVWVVVHSKNWPAVKQAFFNGEEFRDTFPEIARKFVRNIEYFLIAEVVILALALLIAVMRSFPGAVFFPLRVMAIIYTDLFRGLPVILLVYLLGFGVPSLDLPGVPHSATFWAVTALVLCYAAYVAEVYRAGIESVHPSQVAAARALGLSRWKALRFVVIPQAIRRVIPPLLNDFIGLQKDTALVAFVVAVPEAFKEAQLDQQADFNFTPLLCAAVLFLAVTIPMTRFVDWLLARQRARREGDGPVTSANGSEALRLEGIHKSFGKLEVLKGIDLVVAEHEVVCLIGASGSGKSTLLRCVNLLEPVDEGRVVIEGRDVTAGGGDVNEVRRRIGIVFQSFNLFPHMTVLRNITLGPVEGLGTSKREAVARADELLARFGLADKRDDYPDRLSGGQQQRVAIVRALAMQPRLMLLDEVTSALDPELVAEVLNVIRELAATGMTMLIATHEMGFARDIADRVVFLDGGRILEEGPPDRIFSEPENERTRAFLQRIIEAGRL